MRRLVVLLVAFVCASSARFALPLGAQDPSSGTSHAANATSGTTNASSATKNSAGKQVLPSSPGSKLEPVGAARLQQDPSATRLGPQDAGTSLTPVAPPPTAVRATATFSRAEAQIGEALELRLELEHPANVTPSLVDPGEFAGAFAIVERGSRVLVDGAGSAPWNDKDSSGASNRDGASSGSSTSSDAGAAGRAGPDASDAGRSDAAVGANDLGRADGSALVRSSITLRVLALEGGELTSPPLEIEWTADGSPQRLLVTPARVRVASALGDGEDAPRPLRGFRDSPAVDPSASTGRHVAAGAVVAALLALAALLVARARARRKVVARPQSALEGLAALVALAQQPDADRRALVFALTKLVRAQVDAHHGVDRAGALRSAAQHGVEARHHEARSADTIALTSRASDASSSDAHGSEARAAAALPDEAWCALRTASPGQPGAAALAALFAHVERIKYGGEVPSPLLWQDLVAQARAVLEALAAAANARKEAA